MYTPPVNSPVNHSNAHPNQTPSSVMSTGTNNYLNHSFPGAGQWPVAPPHVLSEPQSTQQLASLSISGPAHFYPPSLAGSRPVTSTLPDQPPPHIMHALHKPNMPPPTSNPIQPVQQQWSYPRNNQPSSLAPPRPSDTISSSVLGQSLPIPFQEQIQYSHQVHHNRSLSSKTESSGGSFMKLSPVSTPLIDTCESQFKPRPVSQLSNSPLHQQCSQPSPPFPPATSSAFHTGPPLPPSNSTIPSALRNLPPPPPQPRPLQSGNQSLVGPPLMPPVATSHHQQMPAPPSLQYRPTGPPLPVSNSYQMSSMQNRLPAPPMPPMPTSNSYQQSPSQVQQTRPGMLPPAPPPTSQAAAVQQSQSRPNNQWTGSGLENSFNHMQLGAAAMVNLMKEKNLFPAGGIDPPRPEFRHNRNQSLSTSHFAQANCHPDVMRCTLNAIPQSPSLLTKSRLPLGLLLHPFRDLTSLPVIQSSVIVRCRSCRTYINPFVSFPDSRRWKCNVCFRQNDLPEEFQYDPVSRVYGEPQRRPEIRSATVEFIAPTEYMLRPPQPAVYVFLMDVCHGAVQTAYLTMVCRKLTELLDRLPGDSRTLIGFITYDSGLYFYKLNGDLPRMMICKDIEDVFLPDHDGLLVNLSENKETIKEFLVNLPGTFADSEDTGNCMGSALQAAYKLMSATGGRVSVFNTSLPNNGSGALKLREGSNTTDKTLSANLGPANDFYKTFALECSGQQIAVDLFQLGPNPSDLATIAGITKYSSGSLHYYPVFGPTPADRTSSRYHRVVTERERFRRDLTRYLTRKVGFEAVMRVRCTRGIGIQAFHGNFFVRSTDLLSLPNINPDAGFAIHLSVEESLNDLTVACFQAAILYTSSKAERRIRVHTLCVPLTSQIDEIFRSADHEAITSILAKMAVDRVLNSSLQNAREALVNAVVDPVSVYGTACVSSANRLGNLVVPFHLRLLPLFVLALLRTRALRVGDSTSLDERVAGMEKLKTLPVGHLMTLIYPRLYAVHTIPTGLEQELNGGGEKSEEQSLDGDEDDEDSSEAGGLEGELGQTLPQLHLSAQMVDRAGVYLLDTGDSLVILVGGYASAELSRALCAADRWSEVSEGPLDQLPDVHSRVSRCLRGFVRQLQYDRPVGTGLTLMRSEVLVRNQFINCLLEDRTESTMSYQEFLQYVQKSVKYS